MRSSLWRCGSVLCREETYYAFKFDSIVVIVRAVVCKLAAQGEGARVTYLDTE